MYNEILEDFLKPLKNILNQDNLLERVKDLEGYYKKFTNKHQNSEVAQLLKHYQHFFKGIDDKDRETKLKTIKEILSYNPASEISEEDISKMRFFLEKSLSNYKGVGSKILAMLNEKMIYTVRDILYFLPYSYVDKRNVVKIMHARPGEKVFLKVRIISVSPWKQRGFLSSRKEGIQVVVTDGTGYITFKWFYTPPKFLRDMLVVNNEVYAFGKIEVFRGIKEIHHPEIELVESEKEQTENIRSMRGKILPVYFGLPAGINSKFYIKLVNQIASEARSVLGCIVPKEIKKELQLVNWGEALYQLHFPDEYDEKLYSERRSRFHLSLIYQELFLFFALLNNKKTEFMKTNIKPLEIKVEKPQEIIKNLGYELTNAQKRVVKEILLDLRKNFPMQRLLQGDVGSGKTVVALLAAMAVIDAGKQVVLMAPTEILATQHYLNFKNLTERLGLTPLLLVSGIKKKEYSLSVEKIRTGEAKLIVGTHALIQENVLFNDLGLVIIDEQHRFGVTQRQELIKKGFLPHVLYMTATPIPRTLSMTLYGDLDVSLLDEMPPGRKPVKTVIFPEMHREKVFSMIQEEVKKGRQAYIVYPVIDENNALELKAATQMYDIIKTRFSDYNVALLHGRMTADEKESIMLDFKQGKFSILVATTVIEVGVDVPNATIMVIEHGERFGLSSLHQLRGRIGRGANDANCVVLVDTKKMSEKARKRLVFFRDVSDGFKLAEFDLKLRGPGEIFGTKQSGLPEFSVVDLIADAPLIELMKKVTSDFFASNEKNCYYNTRLNDILRLYFSKNIDYFNVG